MDWLQDWLEDEPEARYQGALSGMNPWARQYFGGRYQDFYNRYLGQAASSAEQGQTPTQTWGQYLGGTPWQQRLQNIPMWQRGIQSQPRNRWLLY